MGLNKSVIKCPYCHWGHAEYWEYIDPTQEEDEFTFDCESCDVTFNVVMSTDIWFDTSTIPHKE